MILAVLMVLFSAACSTEKEPDIIPDVPVTPVEPPVEDKTVDLLLSVSTTQQENATRQSAEATQNAGNFRGIVESEMKLIPFDVTRAIAKDDTPMQLFTEVPSAQDANNKFYLAELKDVIIGTASFLCYAKAPAIKDGENVDKPKNGVLTFDHNANYTPSETTFSLEKIYDDNWSGTGMEYMTQIATADGWNINSDDGPSTLFKEFAAFSNGEYQPFAGSSANIVTYVNKWYTKVGSLADETLRSAIQAAILKETYVNISGTTVTSMKTVIPSASLPAGSAVIKWADLEKKFMYQNTPNDPESYVYPAELYYYANSQIKTSTTHWKTEYQSSTNTWDNILGKYTVDNGVVDATTRSIAIKEPLSYGVACLAVKIRAGVSTDYLTDSNENYEASKIQLNDNSFPLTAILVGSQVEQGFDFTPKNPADDTEKEHIIYDPVIDQSIYLGAVKATDETTFSKPVHTLALQTKEDKTVKVVLEFENNSDKTIVSESGDIFPGTKFYMVASIIPTGGTGDSDLYNRVLTRGHITTIELTIKSLKQAYNTLPNLNSDKLRVFETVKAGVSDWKPGLTTSHDVYNW